VKNSAGSSRPREIISKANAIVLGLIGAISELRRTSSQP
jgi:hypothetical protein